LPSLFLVLWRPSADFDYGTYIIDRPGKYRLCEDITFDPNPPRSGQHVSEAFQPDYSVYDTKAYGLGFFAAISIVADGVDIYLDGHTLEQSKGHALIQRFYANIELGSSPFIEDAGPADFGEFKNAKNVRILGPGIIGRASHHGIHGNDNVNVEVVGVTFDDFEVAAVSLNNVDGLLIEDCNIPKNRRDVPVVGIFSAAHFIGYVFFPADCRDACEMMYEEEAGFAHPIRSDRRMLLFCAFSCSNLSLNHTIQPVRSVAEGSLPASEYHAQRGDQNECRAARRPHGRGG